MGNPLTPSKGRYLDIDEWKSECLLAEQKCEHLQEKLDVMTKERDDWKSKAEKLMEAVAEFLNFKLPK